jgi:hypothetical protein
MRQKLGSNVRASGATKGNAVMCNEIIILPVVLCGRHLPAGTGHTIPGRFRPDFLRFCARAPRGFCDMTVVTTG